MSYSGYDVLVNLGRLTPLVRRETAYDDVISTVFSMICKFSSESSNRHFCSLRLPRE
jgi:hypothetical protein